MTDRAWLEGCFTQALDTVRGERVIPSDLPIVPPLGGRLRVIGLGKAALAMARGARVALRDSIAIRESLSAGRTLKVDGLLIVKDQSERLAEWSEFFDRAPSGLEFAQWQILPGGHPRADQHSERAGRALLDFVAGSKAEDRYLVLLSGGASALAAQPIPGVTLAQKSACVHALMQRGAPIADLNLLRRHLSVLKGGGLSRAIAPAEHWTLAISDVPGDDPRIIGSAPTIVIPPEPEQVMVRLKEYGLWDEWRWIMPPIEQHLARCASASAPTSEKRSEGTSVETSTETSVETSTETSRYTIVASLDQALTAAEAVGRGAGLHTLNLGRVFYGDVARHAAQFCAAIRAQVAKRSHELTASRFSSATPTGTLILAAGEPTLAVTGAGLGGRAQHFALLCAQALQGVGGVTVLAAGTDGSDGPTPAAGACIDGESWAAMHASGIDPAQALRDHDSHTALRAIDAVLHTGPTGTNVADLFLAVVR